MTICSMAKRKRQAAADEFAAASGGSGCGKGRNGYKGYTLPEGGRIDCISMQQALDCDFVGDYVRLKCLSPCD